MSRSILAVLEVPTIVRNQWKREEMLFRIENRVERDDWEGLTNIIDPFHRALEALAVDQEAEAAQSYLRTAIIAARISSDLTQADCIRVVNVLKEEFDKARAGRLAAVISDLPSFSEIMKRAMSVDQALSQGELSLEDVFDEGKGKSVLNL